MNKRITAPSLAVLLAMTVITIVLRTTPAAKPYGGLAVSGRGHVTIYYELETFSFNAVTHEDGSVTGQAKFLNRDTGVQEHITINCLRVLGNTAYISGTITLSGYPKHEGQTRYFIVEDNGEETDDLPDKILLLPANGKFDCNNTLIDPLLWPVPIEAGNIQVRSW